MRIGLINEGTYPVAKGGVSTWCDQLITQLPEHQWDIVTIVGAGRTSVWERPSNTASLTYVPMWDEPPGVRFWNARGTGRQISHIQDAQMRLWQAVLTPDDSANLNDLRQALIDISQPGPQHLSWLLTTFGSSKAILASWKQHRRHHPNLPPMYASQAAQVAHIVDRMLAVAQAEWPVGDLSHVTSNGASALIGMVRQWRHGTPMVLTEHGVYLRERYLALGSAQWDWTVRYAIMTLSKALCQLAYEEATIITPVSHFNGRWEQQLGAPAHKITPIFNGVDTTRYRELTREPAESVVTFVGRIDPLKDLITLVEAFAVTRQRVPNAKLKLFGPVPAGNEPYQAYVAQRIADFDLHDAVTFEGPTDSAVPAFEAGQVVALSSISEGLPFTVIECMASGRPSVNTDVGGVSECLGPDDRCGILVPPRDPQALGNALADLLRDAPRRAAMGKAARERALTLFDLPVFAGAYRDVYDMVVQKSPREVVSA